MNPPPRFSVPSRTVDGRFTDVQSHQAEDESESYMALTKKQIKQLKALAHHLNPIIQVGKNDLSDAAVKQADETIEKRELIKCDVLDGSGLTAKEAGEELAERLGAELVQVIGNRFVLYRASHRDDIEKIKLVRG